MADTDIQLYVNSMARIRERINYVQTVNVNKIEVGSTVFKAELMFLNLRKVLEEIAFSTLAANKDVYSTAYTNFSTHWKAKAILEELKKLNTNFYPVALKDPISAGHDRHFEPIQDGYMTPDEFVTLYQASSEVLHTRNPYKEGDPTVQAKYTVQEWVWRIQTLLSLHRVQLLNGSLWIVNIPPTGNVHAWPATPISVSGTAI